MKCQVEAGEDLDPTFLPPRFTDLLKGSVDPQVKDPKNKTRGEIIGEDPDEQS